MRLLHIACQPVSPNPLQGRAGFAIISITGVSHAYTGPIRSGNPVQWRIPCGVVIRLTCRRRSFSTITTLQTSSLILWYARLRHPTISRIVQRRWTMSSSVDTNVFKVRHHSAITIDAPILISFLMPMFLPICLFINFRRKPSQTWFVLEKPHRTRIVWDYSWSHWDHWRYSVTDFGRPT